MDPHRRIELFSLHAHTLAVQRLRERPSRIGEAIEVLQRWRAQANGPTHCDPYWNEWETLLRAGIDAVECAVTAQTDHAAVLRSVSPLGRFITTQERQALLRQARDAA